ncbi:MAG: hypothetical protein KJO50_03375 [Bacteroidia bacterium]|nr:hypothetical protein [Bacteroidia bacterium]MBT8229273.1 hypothetical protein [Bacteroidia bacterium]NNK89202.1 hypothetical protein [Saprospiraceae bacterium]
MNKSNFNIRRELERSISYVIFMIFLISPGFLVSQEKETIKSRMGIEVIQLSESSVKTNVHLRARVNKVYRGVSDVDVNIIGVGIEEDIKLGTVKTDKDGKANMIIEDISRLEKNEEGYYTILAEFEGSEGYKGSDRDAEFKPAVLTIEALEEDSIYKLLIKSYEPDSMLPLAEQIVTISVPRLFSDLVIAEEETNDEGLLEIEFPNDIMVHEGNDLEITASMIETDDYGTLRASITKPWGLNPVKAERAERALWTPNAPVWMLLTFVGLMGAVWGHFLIIGIKLYLIRKDGIS